MEALGTRAVLGEEFPCPCGRGDGVQGLRNIRPVPDHQSSEWHPKSLIKRHIWAGE